jgi:uncharacterized protein (DUF302 family)
VAIDNRATSVPPRPNATTSTRVGRRRVLVTLWSAAFFNDFAIMTSNASAPDLVELASQHHFDVTVDRLKAAIINAGLQVFTTIDHAAAAQAVGLTMPKTVVVLYGNPRDGTPIMQATPTAALDLPLRVLVRVDSNGRTLIAFHPIAEMLTRAGVPEQVARRLESAQRRIATAISA